MKKTYSSKRKYFIFPGLLFICLFFINTSCGLDVLDALLEDPFVTTEVPNESSAFDKCTFQFSTQKLDNANDFGKCFVYYKIYNKASIKNSEKTTLDNIAADSSRKHNAYSQLLNNYYYQPLYFVQTAGGQEEEFSLENDSHEISIRLTNYLTDAYSARIIVDGSTVGTPVRYNGKTFDFGRNGDKDGRPVKVPSAEENTSDVKRLADDPDDPDTFYVVLYGIFYMPSESFDKIIYSPIHYLGEVKINAADPNN